MKTAMTKIKESLTNNIGIKIIAVVIAASIWLAVVNVNDPEKTVMIYNVPIMITNESAITEQGMVYNVNSTKYVNLTVSGKRSVVSNLSPDDFVATASLEELSKVNSIPIEIRTKNNSLGRKITVLKQSIQSIVVEVEEVEQETFHVEVDYTGKTADGFMQGDYSLSHNTVKVQAPTSVLDRIERVVVVCDLDNADSDISKKCNIVLYDRRGKEIKSKDIKLSEKKIEINVNILKVKQVPIVYETEGEPAGNCYVADNKISHETVNIVGTEAALDSINEINIKKGIDIAGASKDVTKKIDLKKELPKGISIHGDSNVEVTIVIKEYVTRTFELNASDIEISNLGKKYEVELADDKISVTLSGKEEDFERVSENDISGSVDLKDYDKGTHKINIDLSYPENLMLISEARLKVKIKNKK